MPNRFVPKDATDKQLIAALRADLADAEKENTELFRRIYALQRPRSFSGMRELLTRMLEELDLAERSALTDDEVKRLRGK